MDQGSFHWPPTEELAKSWDASQPDTMDLLEDMFLDLPMPQPSQDYGTGFAIRCCSPDISSFLKNSDAILNSETLPPQPPQHQAARASFTTTGRHIDTAHRYYPSLTISSTVNQDSRINSRSLGLGPSPLHPTSQFTLPAGSMRPSAALADIPGLEYSSSASSCSHHDPSTSTQTGLPRLHVQRHQKIACFSCNSVSHNNRVKKLRPHVSKAHAKELVAKLGIVFQSSISTKGKFESLQRQLDVLIDEMGEDYFNTELDEIHGVETATDESFVNVEIVNSANQSQVASSSFSLIEPPQSQSSLKSDLQAVEALGDERTRYYCTYNDCKVIKRSCNCQEKRCQCPRAKGPYWSHSESDWRRHEESLKHWPQVLFKCLDCMELDVDREGIEICPFCRQPTYQFEDVRQHYLHCVDGRWKGETFARKDHLCNHLNSKHKKPGMSEHVNDWCYPSDKMWPHECGFCGDTFDTWDRRMKHLGQHYQSGSKIEDWVLPFPRPVDKKPSSFSPNTQKDNDDDEDNDFGHNGRNSRRNLINYGVAPASSDPCQLRHLDSAEQYGSMTPSECHQQRDQATIVPLSEANDIAILYRAQTPALKMYLSHVEDRVPGLAVLLVEDSLLHHPKDQDISKTRIHAVLDSRICYDAELIGLRWTTKHQVAKADKAAKLLLARSYLMTNQSKLESGIFWLNSRTNPGIKNSLWGIAEFSILADPAMDSSRLKFFHKLIRCMTPNLGLGVPLLCYAATKTSISKRCQQHTEEMSTLDARKRRKVNREDRAVHQNDVSYAPNDSNTTGPEKILDSMHCDQRPGYETQVIDPQERRASYQLSISPEPSSVVASVPRTSMLSGIESTEISSMKDIDRRPSQYMAYLQSICTNSQYREVSRYFTDQAGTHRYPRTTPIFPRMTDSKPRLDEDEVAILEREFQRNPKPSTQIKRQYAEEMGVELPRINVRARTLELILTQANLLYRIGSKTAAQSKSMKIQREL